MPGDAGPILGGVPGALKLSIKGPPDQPAAGHPVADGYQVVRPLGRLGVGRQGVRQELFFGQRLSQGPVIRGPLVW